MTAPSATQRTNAMDTPTIGASQKAGHDIYPQSHHQPLGTPSSPRTFDMKTLLAKPAPPYARGSGYGSGSESEGVGRRSSERDRRERERARSWRRAGEDPSAERKQEIMKDLTFDHGSPPLDLALDLAPTATSFPSDGPSLKMERTTSRTTTASASRSDTGHALSPNSEPSSPTKPTKRVRNVLRRRPSVVKDKEGERGRSTAQIPHLPSSPVPPLSTSSSSMLRLPNIRIPNSPLFSPKSRSRSPSNPSPKNASASTSGWSSSAAAMSPPSGVWPSPPAVSQTLASLGSNVKRKPVDYSNLPKSARSEPSSASDPKPRVSGRTTTERTRGTSNDNHKQAAVDPDHPRSSRRSSSNMGTLSPAPGSPIRRFPIFGSSSSSSSPKPSSPSPVPSSNSTGSSALTPAGAVAEAYRRQLASAQAAERASPYSLAASSNSSLSFGRPLDNRSTDALSLGLLSNTTFDDDEERGGRLGYASRMRDRAAAEREEGTAFDIITRQHLSPPTSASGHEPDDPPPPAPQQQKRNSSLKPLAEEENSSGPYYTVLGSTTGRLIAVGGPDDHHLSWTPELSANLLGRTSATTVLGGAGAASSSTNAGSSGGAVGVVKTLTRKVSGRFRRGSEAGEGEKDDKRRSVTKRGVSVERGAERKREHKEVAKGRPSLQEDRSGYFSAGESSRKTSRRHRAISPDTRELEVQKKQHRRSLRLSIDKFADEDLPLPPPAALSRTSSASGSRTSREAPSRPRRTKSAFGGSPSTMDPRVAQKLGKSETPSPNPSNATSSPEVTSSAVSSPNPASASSSSGGSRIWKLMKKISTGGLRDKYSHSQHLADAPPVPPLPAAHSTSNTASPFASPVTSAHPGRQDRTPRQSMNPPPKRKPSNINSSKLAEPTSPISTPQRSHITSPASPTQQSPGHSSAHSHAQSSNMTRPSTTTRSSSPSSAMFSTYSSPLQASALSSASSLPNSSSHGHGTEDHEVPPVPNLAQWIVPPSELKKMYDEAPAGPAKEKAYQDSSPSRRHKLRLTMPAAPSPSSFSRLNNHGDDYTMVPTPSVQLASLPLPPRRPRTAPTSPSAEALKFASSAFRSPSTDSFKEPSNVDDADDQPNRSASPDIPTFSTAAPINAFKSKRLSSSTARSRPSPASAGLVSGSETQQLGTSPASSSSGALSPPPRPTRSRMRPTPSPPDGSPPTSNAAALAASPEMLATAPDLKRRSTSAQSTKSTATARPTDTGHSRHRSGSLSMFRFSASLSGSSGNSTPSSGHTRSRMSSSPTSSQKAASSSDKLQPGEHNKTSFFRSLGRSTGKQLSEKEKDDRWEDLLLRSDRAGGTLHLEVLGGETGLSSDQLRFSQLTIDDNNQD